MTTVLESWGTITVVVLGGGAGLLLLMHPETRATRKTRATDTFMGCPTEWLK
jgi:hypothetical protein